MPSGNKERDNDVQSHQPLPAATRKKGTAKITVVARKRPLLQNEMANGATDSILLDPDNPGKLSVSEPKKHITGAVTFQSTEYEFDRVYGASHTTEHVYEDCVLPLVNRFLTQGGKNTLFTFGQTGSGKSFSILGCPSLYLSRSKSTTCVDFDMEDELGEATVMKSMIPNAQTGRSHWGFVQFAVDKIFQQIISNGGYLRLSCYEIYANKVYDLLNDRNVLRPLETRSGEVSVHGLEFAYCSTPESVLALITEALKTRTVSANMRNKTSSRGHMVSTLEIVDTLPAMIMEDDNQEVYRMKVSATEQSGIMGHNGGHPTARLGGKMAFIDLAGTERGNESTSVANKMRQLKATPSSGCPIIGSGRSNANGGPKGDKINDGADINRSLLALKECFRAIDNGNTHVPFRNSQLTKVLREFLVPLDSHTVMMAHVSPSNHGLESAINALQYTSMVVELRRRCQPLLGKQPPTPHESELYKVVVPKPLPKLPLGRSKDPTSQIELKSSRSQPSNKRRFTTLPSDFNSSPKVAPTTSRRTLRDEINKNTAREMWQPSNNSDKRPSHDPSAIDSLLPSPDNRSNHVDLTANDQHPYSTRMSRVQQKELAKLMKEKRSTGLAPPTPRPSSASASQVARSARAPQNMSRQSCHKTNKGDPRPLKTPLQAHSSPLISPQSIPSRMHRRVQQQHTLVGMDRTQVVGSMESLETLISQIEDSSAGSEVYFACKSQLSRHLASIFASIHEQSTPNVETSELLRTAVSCEARLFSLLRAYLLKYESWLNQMPVDNNDARPTEQIISSFRNAELHSNTMDIDINDHDVDMEFLQMDSQSQRAFSHYDQEPYGSHLDDYVLPLGDMIRDIKELADDIGYQHPTDNVTLPELEEG